MAYTTEQRRQLHKKQERMNVGIGVPLASDLREGVPTLRSTTDGIIEYINYGGVLYENRFVKSLDQNKFGESIAEDGYVKFDNGLILQWGEEAASSGNITVTFPLPFPNACLNVVCTDYDDADGSGIGGVTGLNTLPSESTTTITFSCYNAVDNFFWQAIGN